MCSMPNEILVLGFVELASYHEFMSHCKQPNTTTFGEKANNTKC